MIEVEIINESNNDLPKYATDGSAGIDLRANINEEGGCVILKPFERKLISTGIRISLPNGYEAQIRPRSGLALKHGITVLNTPGTIDSDYTGIIGVILINFSDNDFTVFNGDRIAQMVISKYEVAELKPVEELKKTTRGCGGFGHTGV